MAKVELKKPIVEEIAETVKDAESVILVATVGSMSRTIRLFVKNCVRTGSITRFTRTQ